MKSRILAGTAVAALGLGLILIAPASPVFAATCKGGTPSDFNGDGISDAAIAEPNGSGGFGSVHIIYGTRAGLTAGASGTALDDQLIGSTNSAASFGDALVTADFDGDGCTDLAVGDPSETVSGKINAGSVHIYTGGPGGLFPEAPIIDPATFGDPEAAGAEFGSALAVGDVNGDKLPDLIIGAPGENSDTGAIYIAPGNRSLQLTMAKRFAEGDSVVGGVAATDDAWGSALATADFNGDKISDVAIGARGRSNDEGSVSVLRGSGTSALLTATARQAWSQDSTGVPGSSEPGDVFGWALTTGDFNGDTHPDLAVGVPGETVGTIGDAGTVDVIYNSSSGSGLTGTGVQAWNLTSPGLNTTAGAGDQFGKALAAGNFNGDKYTDLAVGVPFYAVSGHNSAGSVIVLPGGVLPDGSGAGLTSGGSTIWNQATPGIGGTPEDNDSFGYALTVLRTRSASRDDLLVGVVSEAVGSIVAAGAAEFIPSSANGLTATDSELWDDDSTGIKGAPFAEGQFGTALA